MDTQVKLSLFGRVRKILKKKRNIVIIVLIIVGIIGYFLWHKNGNGSKHTLETATIGSITEEVSETGNITTAGITPIYSTTTGMVEEVLVKNGDMVEKDVALFKVVSTATKQEKDAALSTYMAAKSALETAKATQLAAQASMFGKWDAYKELAESDDYENVDGTPRIDQRLLPEYHTPEKEWLSAEASYKNQQQVISEKSVTASAAWQAYQATQDSEITAVLGGEVRNLGVAVGDTVIAPTVTTLSTTSPSMVVVDDSVNTYIKLMVNETDAVKIVEGQKARVELDAIDGIVLSAVVDRIDTVAINPQDLVKYAVYILLEESDDLVRRGMTADVEITVAAKEDIIVVPSSAIKPYQGGKAVRVVNDKDEVDFVPVEIGIRGDGKTEIISGISEGTEVVAALANEDVERSGGLF